MSWWKIKKPLIKLTFYLFYLFYPHFRDVKTYALKKSLKMRQVLWKNKYIIELMKAYRPGSTGSPPQRDDTHVKTPALGWGPPAISWGENKCKVSKNSAWHIQGHNRRPLWLRVGRRRRPDDQARGAKKGKTWQTKVKKFKSEPRTRPLWGSTQVSHRLQFTRPSPGGISWTTPLGEWGVKENIGKMFAGSERFIIFFNVATKYNK
jgi:transcription elongation factor